MFVESWGENLIFYEGCGSFCSAGLEKMFFWRGVEYGNSSMLYGLGGVVLDSSYFVEEFFGYRTKSRGFAVHPLLSLLGYLDAHC